MFPADVPTTCEVGGPTGRNINIMWDRTRCSAQVKVVKAEAIVCKSESLCRNAVYPDRSVVVGPEADSSFVVALGGPALVNTSIGSFLLDRCGEVLRIEHAADGATRFQVLEGMAYVCTFRLKSSHPSTLSVCDAAPHAAAWIHQQRTNSSV